MRDNSSFLETTKRILVAGAGGFIGGNLVKRLTSQGYNNIRAVDIKPLNEWFFICDNSDNQTLDLSKKEHCDVATKNIDVVFNLASDMGGMGYIESHKAKCMLSSLINTHLLLSSKDNLIQRYFFSSSACVYNASKQNSTDGTPLKEEDAYPAMPEDGYGWEKLFGEHMCRHFMQDFGLETRVARFHNVYGPLGTYSGGREKAPAAICRKIIEAKLGDLKEIEVWGDGTQTRTFLHIDDCLDGIISLMNSDVREPINIGSSELVSINQLVSIVEDIANYKVTRIYNQSKPRGVLGRSSDNTKANKYLHWSPKINIHTGMKLTFDWIYQNMTKAEK